MDRCGVSFQTLFARQCNNASEQLRDYRVVQNAVDQLQVTIDAEQACRSECERAVRRSLDALLVGEKLLLPSSDDRVC